MATANPNPCTRPNPNHYPNPNSNPEPNQAWTPRVIKTSVVSHSPRYATATAPLANLLEEFRQAMESSGEMLYRRREQARRSVRPLRSRSGTPKTRLTRSCSEAGRVPLWTMWPCACLPRGSTPPPPRRGVHAPSGVGACVGGDARAAGGCARGAGPRRAARGARSCRRDLGQPGGLGDGRSLGEVRRVTSCLQHE